MPHLKKSLLICVNIYLTVVILAFIYLSRVSLSGWHWTYWLLAAYGIVVTPFLIFRLAFTYLYKPVPDQGFRPSVSVIVPVYNEENGIGETIDSILNSDYPKDKLELVVIDDKSTDKTLEVINKKHLTCDFKVVTLDKNMGKRHAMASGIKQSTGEVLVCVDSDTVVKPDAVKMLVQPFADESIYCVCGNAVVVNESHTKVNTVVARFQKVWYADAFRLRKGIESLFGMVLCCSGVLSAYRREKFDKVVDEWLNETFLGREVVSGDDRQMTNLMLRMGGKSVFQSTALSYTIAPHKLKKFVNQQVRWGRSSFRGMLFASKFFLKKNLFQKIIFYTTMFVTYMSPLTMLLSTVGLALLGRYELVVGYFLGLLVVSALAALSDKLLVEYFTFKDIGYRIAFSMMTIVITFVYLYSWITPWKGKVWGTR